MSISKPCCGSSAPTLVRTSVRLVEAAGLGLMFLGFFLQTVTDHQNCSRSSHRASVPSSLLFLARKARCPGSFQQLHSPPPHASGAAGPGAGLPGVRKPSRLQTFERGWGSPGGRGRGAQVFPAGTPPLLSWAASPGFPAAGCWGPAAPRRGGSDRSRSPRGSPNLNSWRQSVQAAVTSRPRCQQEEEGQLRATPGERLAPPALQHRAQPAPSGLQPAQARRLRCASVRPSPGIPAL